jgi:cell division protein FtsX
LKQGIIATREEVIVMAKLSQPARDRISEGNFAFPKQRKEPLENATHVRNAIARFDQVKGVTEAEREQAWKRIRAAAKQHGVAISNSRD